MTAGSSVLQGSCARFRPSYIVIVTTRTFRRVYGFGVRDSRHRDLKTVASLICSREIDAVEVTE